MDGESSSLLVRSDANEEVLLSVELSRVGESGVTDLVEGIGRVGDQFTKEDFLQSDTREESQLNGTEKERKQHEFRFAKFGTRSTRAHLVRVESVWIAIQHDLSVRCSFTCGERRVIEKSWRNNGELMRNSLMIRSRS